MNCDRDSPAAVDAEFIVEDADDDVLTDATKSLFVDAFTRKCRFFESVSSSFFT